MGQEDKVQPVADDGPLTADKVADYLVANPDFLHNRPDVLARMIKAQKVRPRPDGIIDLQSFMVDRL
ncbi:MAG: hypothetical protein AAGG65_19030, partial [Pseudomonadota bacterium]